MKRLGRGALAVVAAIIVIELAGRAFMAYRRTLWTSGWQGE